MTIKEIQEKYGANKLDQMYDILLSCPQSELAEELMETYSDEILDKIMSSFDNEEDAY
jgi:hypothetical protein